MTTDEAEDIAWREFNIHRDKESSSSQRKDGDTNTTGNDIDDNDNNVNDEGNDHDSEQDNQEFMFGLFDKPDDEETTVYEFPNLPMISLRGKSEYTNSTGLQVWLGSEVLCDFIQSRPSEFITQKNVLELGAGLGLCGIVAHHLGAAKVLMTDGDTNVLETLRWNVKQNEKGNNNYKDFSISCPQLIWGRGLEQFRERHGTFDTALATDCIYMPQSLEPLWETINYLLTPDGTFLYVNLCTSQAPIEKVLDTASKYKFVWTTHVAEKTGNQDVYVFRRQEEL